MTSPDFGRLVTPNPSIHTPPPETPGGVQGLTPDQISDYRGKFIEMILQQVILAISGLLNPTSAFTQIQNFFDFSNPNNLLSGLINGVVGGSGNPIANLISSLLGTASTASTAGTNATTALGFFTSLFAGLPGVSTIAGFLSFLQPSGSGTGIFAPLITGVSGGTLSSLISSFLGTASTASTASTNASTSLGNWTTLLAGIPGVSTVTHAGNVISNVLTSIGNPTGMNTTPGSFNPVSAGVQILDALIPDLGFLRNGLFSGLTGHSGTTDVTEGAVTEATASTSEAVAGLGAGFTQLAAALSNTGTPDADDFERSSIGAGWQALTSTSTLSIPDGHNLHFAGTGTAEYVMRRVTANAVDRMTSTAVLNESIPTYFFLPVPYGGYVDVWVRCTAFTTYATRSGVRLRINSTGLGATWVLANVVSGTATTLTSGTCKIPGKGGFPSLEAGAGGTPRRFVGTLSGAAIDGCDFTDSSLVTGLGPTYRWRGFGGRGNTGVGIAQGTPDIRQWGGG